MSSYWLGVVSVPVVIVLAVVAYGVLVRLAAWIGNAAANVVRITPETREESRAAFGALAYSAERAWFVALGDMGVALFFGQGARDKVAAYGRLREGIPLRTLKRRSGGDA